MVTFTALAVTLIAQRALGEKKGLAAGLLFSCLTTMGDLRLVASDGESLMNLPMCFGMLLFLIALETRRPSHFFWTGILIGLAAQFRYQAGIQLAVVGSYLLLYEPFFSAPKGERLAAFRRGLVATLLITFAFLLTFALVFGWLWWMGSWDAYSFWSWEYQVDYIRDGLKTINPWKKGLSRTTLTILGGFIIWWSAGKTLFRHWRDKNPLVVIGLLWLLLGYAAVATGGRFSPRYFTQIFPPLALLASMTFAWSRKWQRWALLIPLLGFWLARFFSPEIYAAAGVYDYTRFQKEIGHYIHERTKPEDRIFIWGWGNGIYIYSERMPATRFMNSDFVTGRIQGSPTAYDLNFDTSFNVIPGSWEMLMVDLERYRPAYFLDTAPANIHDYVKYPIAKYPHLQQYLDQHYTLETTLHAVELYRRINHK